MRDPRGGEGRRIVLCYAMLYWFILTQIITYSLLSYYVILYQSCDIVVKYGILDRIILCHAIL